MSNIAIGCRQTLWLPIFFLAHYKLYPRSCELLVAKAGHKLCLLPDTSGHSPASQLSACLVLEVVGSLRVVALARNSVENRQTVDLMGQGEH